MFINYYGPIVFFFNLSEQNIIRCTSTIWIWALNSSHHSFPNSSHSDTICSTPESSLPTLCKKRKRKEKWPLFRSEFAEGKPFALCEWFKSQWVWFIVFSQTSIICKNSTWFCNKGPVSSSIESCCSVAVITGAFSVSLLLGLSLPLSASVKVQLSFDAELMLI